MSFAKMQNIVSLRAQGKGRQGCQFRHRSAPHSISEGVAGMAQKLRLRGHEGSPANVWNDASVVANAVAREEAAADDAFLHPGSASREFAVGS